MVNSKRWIIPFRFTLTFVAFAMVLRLSYILTWSAIKSSILLTNRRTKITLMSSNLDKTQREKLLHGLFWCMTYCTLFGITYPRKPFGNVIARGVDLGTRMRCCLVTSLLEGAQARFPESAPGNRARIEWLSRDCLSESNEESQDDGGCEAYSTVFLPLLLRFALSFKRWSSYL